MLKNASDCIKVCFVAATRSFVLCQKIFRVNTVAELFNGPGLRYLSLRLWVCRHWQPASDSEAAAPA